MTHVISRNVVARFADIYIVGDDIWELVQQHICSNIVVIVFCTLVVPGGILKYFSHINHQLCNGCDDDDDEELGINLQCSSIKYFNCSMLLKNKTRRQINVN